MNSVLLVLLAAATGTGVSFLARTEPRAVAEAEEDLGENIEGVGHVEPASEVRRLSAKTGGLIRECHVQAGAVVRKGTVLVVLHDEKETAALAVARRQLEVACAEEAQMK